MLHVPHSRFFGHVCHTGLQAKHRALEVVQRYVSATLATFQPAEAKQVFQFLSTGCHVCFANLLKHQLVLHCAAALARGLELFRSTANPAKKATVVEAVCYLANALRACCVRLGGAHGGEQDPQHKLLFAKEVTSSGEQQQLQEAGSPSLLLCACCWCSRSWCMPSMPHTHCVHALQALHTAMLAEPTGCNTCQLALCVVTQA